MQQMSGTTQNCRVVIVGAGVSGITAGARIINAGLTGGDDVIVLEGSNRIGGRVCTKSFDRDTVELGAQWVHGEKGNVIYETVKRSGASLLEDSDSDFINVVCVLSDKTVVDKDVTMKLYLMCDDIRQQIDRKSIGSEANGQSYADYFVPRYKEYIQSRMPDVGVDVRDGFLGWLHQFDNSIEGADSWHETSVSSLVNYRECEGNSLTRWKTGGYNNVIGVICDKYGVSKAVLEKLVKLNKEVVRIYWNEGCQKNSLSTSKCTDRVVVVCADGSQYSAECIIVTVSLGVLKQNYSTLFQPSLPVEKINVIKGLGIGTVDKIFVKFPYRWWPDKCPGFSLLWTRYDLDHTDFIQGDANRWIKDVFGFYIVDSAENLLCGWVVGESARIMEQQSDEVVLNACYKLLEKFLSGTYNIPKPEAILRSRWQSDPFIRGAYSFRSVLSDKLKVFHDQLCKPLVNDSGKKVVFFAGEACHPYFFSTVHGAIETGCKQAEQLMAVIPEIRPSDVPDIPPRSKL